MFVITGSPRSATGFASTLFTNMGFDCGHEKIFRPKATLYEVVEWAKNERGCESSWLAWMFLSWLPDPIVFHTLRNPWNVIDSLATRNDILPREANVTDTKKILRDICNSLVPEVNNYDNAYDRAACFVLGWNTLILDAVAASGCEYHPYRVEDISLRSIKGMLELAGEKRSDFEIIKALANTPTNMNAGTQTEYGVPIKNPVILKAYKDFTGSSMEDTSVTVVKSTVEKSTKEEIIQHLDDGLKDKIDSLAETQGYKIPLEVLEC